MSAKRLFGTNKTAVYIIAIVVIIGAFLLLGGGPRLGGMMHGNGSMSISHLNWAQILISLVIGFLLGLFAGRRKW